MFTQAFSHFVSEITVGFLLTKNSKILPFESQLMQSLSCLVAFNANCKLFDWNRTQGFVYSRNLYAFDDAFEKFENSLSFSINSSQQICCGHSDKLLENMHIVVKFLLHKYADCNTSVVFQCFWVIFQWNPHSIKMSPI